MPSSKTKQRTSSNALLRAVKAVENGNGISSKSPASEKKKKVMRLKKFRELLQKKVRLL